MSVTRLHLAGWTSGAAALLCTLAFAFSGKSPGAVPGAGEFGEAGAMDPKVIYGIDNRKDIYQITDQETLDAYDSTVAIFLRESVVNNGNGTYTIPSQPTLGQTENLCLGEPFASQPSISFCSGFLVGPDLVATAGHCINLDQDCTDAAFIFGYRMLSAGSAQLTFPASQVYFCQGIVQSVFDAQEELGPDWALVRLDRPVQDHLPLKVRRTGKIPERQSVVLIGYPSGIPAKAGGGSYVLDNTPASYFATNLDTFPGASGSAVFNASTWMVEGVHVRGEPYPFVENGDCSTYRRCPDAGDPDPMGLCRGAHATRTTEFASLVPEIPPPGNDAFAQRFRISDRAGTVRGRNNEATKEPSEPDHAGFPGGASVWWTWQSPLKGTATFETTGSSFRTLLATYTGSTLRTLVPVASDDGGPGAPAKIAFDVMRGTEYQIAVDGLDGATGNVTLKWSAVSTCLNPPAADSPVPAHRESGVPMNTTLSWNWSGDPSASVVFTVYLGVNGKMAKVATTDKRSFYPGTLLGLSAYSWQVVVEDDCGPTTGPEWTFNTGNQTVIRFRRGDVDVDGSVDLSDVIGILFHVFQRTSVVCQKSADVDNSNSVNISDAIWLLEHLFLMSTWPAQPYPDCGADPTPDTLTCAEAPPCV